jgi:hypothetical protein
MVNSKYAMTSISNILMNLIVLEPEFVEESVTFFHILKFIMNSLPLLVNDGKYQKTQTNEHEIGQLSRLVGLGDELVLYGNFAVLGLLILRHHSKKPSSTDFTVFKFIQSIVRLGTSYISNGHSSFRSLFNLYKIPSRFLWDAHNCEESLNEDELGISANYLDYWNDLGDLWFLGMQVLNGIIPQVRFPSEFILGPLFDKLLKIFPASLDRRFRHGEWLGTRDGQNLVKGQT